MKYYEVRCNKNNSRVCLMRSLSNPEGRLLYEGKVNFLKAFSSMGDGFYRPIFGEEDHDGLDQCHSANSLKNMGITHFSKDLEWVVTDSSHRPDVRVVDENLYLRLVNNLEPVIVVASCDHLDSAYSHSFEPIYIVATTAIHKLGDISREAEDVAIVSQRDSEHYCGNWVQGFGFIDVKFPIASSRVISKTEAEEILANKNKG